MTIDNGNLYFRSTKEINGITLVSEIYETSLGYDIHLEFLEDNWIKVYDGGIEKENDLYVVNLNSMYYSSTKQEPGYDEYINVYMNDHQVSKFLQEIIELVRNSYTKDGEDLGVSLIIPDNKLAVADFWLADVPDEVYEIASKLSSDNGDFIVNITSYEATGVSTEGYKILDKEIEVEGERMSAYDYFKKLEKDYGI